MFQLPPLAAINHVLSQQQWARERLAAFAGQTIAVRMPPMPALIVTIRDDGLLKSAASQAAAELTLQLHPATLPLLALRDPAAQRQIEFSGSTELAQTVQHLFEQLEWDYEEDLSRVFGDVLAQRMARAGREFFGWQREAGLRLAQNLAEYWTEEQPLIARRADLARFGDEVDDLRDAVERLEKRIEQRAARAR